MVLNKQSVTYLYVENYVFCLVTAGGFTSLGPALLVAESKLLESRPKILSGICSVLKVLCENILLIFCCLIS